MPSVDPMGLPVICGVGWNNRSEQSSSVVVVGAFVLFPYESEVDVSYQSFWCSHWDVFSIRHLSHSRE